jgi:hypothetical protein
MNGWPFEYVVAMPDSIRSATLKMLKADQDAIERNRKK